MLYWSLVFLLVVVSIAVVGVDALDYEPAWVVQLLTLLGAGLVGWLALARYRRNR
ncbi:MAG: hypothetical protein IT345_15220 [Trueperaceae bacterium]|nr:hypothetical protein [Trueperaceae bacterium]